MNPFRLLKTTALLGLAALGAMASGQTQGFVQKTRTIHAGVLLLDADKQNGNVYGQTAAPFAFYNLDQATSIKPAGWSFSNPYAPGIVTTDIVNRYTEYYQDFGITGAPVPTAGSTISKNDGAYWTVKLSDLSETQIASYDVLLIAVRNHLSLNPMERERLRRFVDGGGVLWVEVFGSGSYGSDNLPLAIQTVGGTGTIGGRDATSPLINGTLQVTDGDLVNMNLATSASLSALATGSPNDRGLAADFSRYHWVTYDGSASPLPTIVEGRIGDGAIVVTARGTAEILNGLTGSTSSGVSAYANEGYLAAAPAAALNAGGQAAARLAVNIVSLGSDFRQPNGGARKSGSAAADPDSPVLSRFTAEGSYGPVSNPISTSPVAGNGAVTYKGYLVTTVGSRVVVFDAVPGRDLDGDGDPDDGIYNASGVIDNTLRDTSVGKPYDVVWVSDNLGSTLSAPVCAEVPEAAGTAASGDQILVTDATGNLHVFALEQRTRVNGPLVGGVHAEVARISPPGGAGTYVNGYPNPPTVIDGLAYMADGQQGALGTGLTGRLWVVDLSTGTAMVSNVNNAGGGGPQFRVGGGSANNNSLPGFTASPTIGYIPIGDSSGGVDRVLYAPGLVTGTTSQPGFASVWIGAKGESPFAWDASGGNLTVTTRAGSSGQLPIYVPDASDLNPVHQQMAPHLTLLDQNGNPITGSNSYVDFGTPVMNSGNGVLTYKALADKSQFTLNGISIRIDYTIDWGYGPDALSANIVRGQLLLPVQTVPSTPSNPPLILGPIALTTRGTLHLIEATPGATGGSYFAFREDAGRGQFRTISRFTLYNSYTETFGTGTGGNAVPPVLEDVDYIGKLPAFFNNSLLSNFSYAGGVAVRNGIVFAPINATRKLGTSALNVPVTMVAAFRAEPETPQLKLGTSLGNNLKINQSDFARTQLGYTGTPSQTSLSGTSLTYDSDNGIVRIDNLASVTHGQMQDCLSLSQPIGYISDSVTLTYRQPDAYGDNWSPLLWFGLWNGGSATNAPLVAGNEVYLPVNTVLPSIVNPDPKKPGIHPSGAIFSVDADAPTSGSYETTLSSANGPASGIDRPWIVQQVQLSTSTTDFTSPYYRMPQVRGITNFSDFALRLSQTEIGTSTSIASLSGGDGVVAAMGNAGVYGLSRADFLVCDEGRLLRVDSAGNAISTTFATRFSGIGNGGGAANTIPLVRPVKAYPTTGGQSLVVDAGGNRVLQLDANGTALRTIDRILLDPNHKPDAYRINEPLTLNDPRDAVTYTEYKVKGATDVVTTQGAVEYWVHTIIADSGNHRVVELVDRFQVDSSGNVQSPVVLPVYDPVSQQTVQVAQVGVLVWQSPSLSQASSVGEYYNSITRVLVGDPASTTNPLRYVYVTGVSRTRPTRSAVGLDNPNAQPTPSGIGGGAVVIFDPLGGTRVFDRFNLQSLAGVNFYDVKTSAFDTNTPANRTAQVDRGFGGVQSVTAETALLSGKAAVSLMVADADAVYEFVIDSAVLADAAGTGNFGTPTWLLNETAFTTLHATTTTGSNPSLDPEFFRPAYARRLESGDVMVVNGYRGLMRDRSTAYTGGVLLFDGTFNLGTPSQSLGFTLNSVRFQLPPLSGIRGLVGPVFADRR